MFRKFDQYLDPFDRVLMVDAFGSPPPASTIIANSPMRIDSAPVRRASPNDPWVRALDIAVAATALLFALPFLVLLAAALQIDSPGPLFFRHRRIGLGGRTFGCLKFRSMHVNAAEMLRDHLATDAAARAEWQAEFKLRNDPRVTRLGRIIRKLSLDELPQLLNVIAGDMSLVGPRPIITDEIERYGEFFSDYCSVRPGLTGIWQISGRNDISYTQRVALDCYYARNKSVWMDLGVLFGTVPAVLRARGSY